MHQEVPGRLLKGYLTVFRNVSPKRLEVLFRNFKKKKKKIKNKKLIKTKTFSKPKHNVVQTCQKHYFVSWGQEDIFYLTLSKRGLISGSF